MKSEDGHDWSAVAMVAHCMRLAPGVDFESWDHDTRIAAANARMQRRRRRAAQRARKN